MTGQDKRNVTATAVAVGLSVLFSYLDLLSLLYTIPVIVASSWYRDGRRLLPAAVAGFLVVSLTLVSNREAFGTDSGRLAILIALFIPVVVWISALLWIGLDGKRFLTRFLASSAVPVIASLAVLVVFAVQADAAKVLDGYFSKTFVDLFQEIAIHGEADPVVNANLTKLYRMVVQGMGAVLGPMMMTVCGVNAFIALSIQQKGTVRLTEKVLTWRLPQDWVWAFLGLWFTVALGYFLSWPYLVKALVINVALSVSLLYELQGFAILLFWLRKRHVTLTAGKLFGWVIVLVLFLPGMNMVGVLALLVVGVLETWFEFRRKDKEISYENHS